jgi:lipoate synthase
MQKAREIAEKDETIEKLREQIKQNGLETVEEALCPQCKNSMEESILVVKKDLLQ